MRTIYSAYSLLKMRLPWNENAALNLSGLALRAVGPEVMPLDG